MNLTTDELLAPAAADYWRKLACAAMALAERWIQDNEGRFERKHESDFECQLVIDYQAAKRVAYGRAIT